MFLLVLPHLDCPTQSQESHKMVVVVVVVVVVVLYINALSLLKTVFTV